jgi:hypothetical protein
MTSILLFIFVLYSKYEFGNALPLVSDLTVIVVLTLPLIVAVMAVGLYVLALTVIVAVFTDAPFDLAVSFILYCVLSELIIEQV